MKDSVSTDKKTRLSTSPHESNGKHHSTYLKFFYPYYLSPFISPSPSKLDSEMCFRWSFIMNIYWHAFFLEYMRVIKTIKIKFANWNFAVVEHWHGFTFQALLYISLLHKNTVANPPYSPLCSKGAKTTTSNQCPVVAITPK